MIENFIDFFLKGKFIFFFTEPFSRFLCAAFVWTN